MFRGIKITYVDSIFFIGSENRLHNILHMHFKRIHYNLFIS